MPAPSSNAYDAEGNCISRTAADSSKTLYTWDNRDRLTSVMQYDTTGTLTQTVKYTYDAFNRWIGETITPASGTATQTRFVYDGNQIVMQFDGAAGGDLTAGDLSHRYLWGPAVDQLLADDQLQGTAQVVWTLTDNQNTVRDLATYSGGTTTVVNHRVFSAYGQLLSQTNAAAADCLFAYTGRPLDQATGLQNNDNRWYNAITGRWLSQDPSGLRPDVNPFRYCGNGPTDGTDPSGLTTVTSPDAFPGATQDASGQYTAVVNDGQDGTVPLQHVTREQLIEQLKKLAARLKGYEEHQGERNRCYEGKFDSQWFQGVGAQHQYYLVEGENNIYADNQLNYIGIGMYEKWLDDSLFKAGVIVWTWKIKEYQEFGVPSDATLYWLAVGYESYDDASRHCGPAKPPTAGEGEGDVRYQRRAHTPPPVLQGPLAAPVPSSDGYNLSGGGGH